MLLALALLLGGCRRGDADATPVVVTVAATPTAIAIMLPATPTVVTFSGATNSATTSTSDTAVVALLPTLPATIPATPTPIPGPEDATVISVIDGDTILAAVGNSTERIRYILVNTPELDEPLGSLALEANRALVEGKTVRLERDRSDRDAYGRLLRYVYLPDGSLVNAELVRQGWAQVTAYPPDVARESELLELQQQAINAGIGQWAAQRGAVTNRQVALREGPGQGFTERETLPTNTPLDIDAVSTDGEWYRVRSGVWVPAYAVTNAPPLPTILLVAVASPTPPPQIAFAAPTPAPGSAQRFVPSLDLNIVQLNKQEEYVVLRNDTDKTINLQGWWIESDNGGERCDLDGELVPGAELRVWSTINSGGFSCGFVGGIWDDNATDNAILHAPAGRTVIQVLPPTLIPTATPPPVYEVGDVKILSLDKVNESLILRNDTDKTINLEGWKLQSETGNEICFLNGEIGVGSLLTVWSRESLSGYACRFEQDIWEDMRTDNARLFDPTGLQVFFYPDPK
jgi:endonuclease YncB( thermonuclease family)